MTRLLFHYAELDQIIKKRSTLLVNNIIITIFYIKLKKIYVGSMCFRFKVAIKPCLKLWIVLENDVNRSN